MMRVTYGTEVQKSDVTYDTIIKDVGKNMAKTGVPGSFMVDYLPIRRHQPTLFYANSFIYL